MKKFLINTFLFISALSSQSLIYPVSCSQHLAPLPDQDFSHETDFISETLTWDFYKDGFLSDKTLCDKINEFSKTDKYHFPKQTLPYDTPNWDSDHYYIESMYNPNENDYNKIKINIYSYKKQVYSFQLDWHYWIDDKREKDLYDILLDFHNKIADKDYFADKKDKTLKEISTQIYDEFFKTAFKSEKEIKDNVQPNGLQVYKFFEDMYFSFYKNGFENNINNHYDDYLTSDNERPFTLQILDNNSHLGLDLNLYDNRWIVKQKLDEKYNIIYKYKTEAFINKKLDSLIDLNNVSFNFNWGYLEQGSKKILKILGVSLDELTEKEKSKNPDYTNGNIIKQNKIDVTKIPDYDNLFLNKNSDNKIGLKYLNLYRFNSITDDKVPDFFKALFCPENEYSDFLSQPYNVINSIFNSLRGINNSKAPFLFFNGDIILSINDKKINVNKIGMKWTLDSESQSNWTGFINELTNNSSNKSLNFEFDNQVDGKYFNFLSKFNFNILVE